MTHVQRQPQAAANHKGMDEDHLPNMPYLRHSLSTTRVFCIFDPGGRSCGEVNRRKLDFSTLQSNCLRDHVRVVLSLSSAGLLHFSHRSTKYEMSDLQTWSGFGNKLTWCPKILTPLCLHLLLYCCIRGSGAGTEQDIFAILSTASAESKLHETRRTLLSHHT
jgi:hypothetical protein